MYIYACRHVHVNAYLHRTLCCRSSVSVDAPDKVEFSEEMATESPHALWALEEAMLQRDPKGFLAKDRPHKDP